MTTESMNHDVSSDELQQKEYAESTQQQQLVDSLKKSSACLEQDALSNCEESINDDALLLNHSLMDDDSDDEHHGSTLTTSSADFTEETPNQRNINDLLFVNHHHDHARDQAERSSSAVALLFQNGRRHAMANAPPTPHRWDHFVRSGTRLKSLLEDAMSEVKTSIVSSARRQKRVRAGGEEGEDEADSSHPRVVTVADFTAELAREKTAQVLQLQRVSISICIAQTHYIIHAYRNPVLHLLTYLHLLFNKTATQRRSNTGRCRASRERFLARRVG